MGVDKLKQLFRIPPSDPDGKITAGPAKYTLSNKKIYYKSVHA